MSVDNTYPADVLGIAVLAATHALGGGAEGVLIYRPMMEVTYRNHEHNPQLEVGAEPWLCIKSRVTFTRLTGVDAVALDALVPA